MNELFEFFSRLTDMSDWPPRWYCGRWTDFHGWLYIASDLTIWLAYMTIPLILIRFVLIKKGVPLPGVFWLFGAFILLCGLTHLIDAMMFWYPAYRLNALIRFLTGAVSIATVIALFRYFNEAVGLRTSKEYDRELSYRMLAMQELTRSNQELQQFAYVASHDLQSPLKTIANYLTLLESKHGAALDTDARRLIGVSAAAAERLRHLINDLLEFSRVGSEVSFTQVNLNELVAEVLEDQQAEIQQVGGDVEVGNLPTLTGHRTDLKQVFQNLISNGLKYRRAGVTPQIRINVKDEGDQYRFSISDNGIGIDRQYYDRVFEIFQRLHGRGQYSGTGIGLATCKKVIEIYGGTIWLESTPGEGTTFFFTIPKVIKTLHHYTQADLAQA
ncbi:two-component sensor histidine kinase [Rudanella paleaurantiibacter]|uniref:histidine kinase n=1 Tax=Rudanella paleaurantiibacter TaxID=2614655 RepID=A0A7J5TVI7_9BACT|nr:ATP-binding protein [Rudanella paleaurantiibacter]KAB7728164.1 two-component sensor histidine kinase [Rudanella paleaurantiibacter]